VAEAPTAVPRPQEADGGRTAAAPRRPKPVTAAPARPSWRRPLIAAALTVAVAAAALIFGYERMSNAASDDAAKVHTAPAHPVKRAAQTP
jgi:ferric-dicitrate binding protein FerR (iron transport regulator)